MSKLSLVLRLSGFVASGRGEVSLFAIVCVSGLHCFDLAKVCCYLVELSLIQRFSGFPGSERSKETSVRQFRVPGQCCLDLRTFSCYHVELSPILRFSGFVASGRGEVILLATVVCLCQAVMI